MSAETTLPQKFTLARHQHLPAPANGARLQSATGLKVRLAGGLTALATPGGGETQLAETLKALQRDGVQAEYWRPWEQGYTGFQTLHLFGSLPEHLAVIEAAHARGIKVAVSPIAWFDLQALWHSGDSLPRRTLTSGKFLMRAAIPRLNSWRRRLYHAADLLLPNSQAEADQLVRFFQVPRERIRVVPNGTQARFAEADAAWLPEDWNLPPNFVLYPGRIEPRKNQLGFLRAMRSSKFPIVFLGAVVPGHREYAKACRRESAGRDVTFLPPTSHQDPGLAGAYAACRCLALTSWFETPGLVALEAGLSGTPLVLTNRGAAPEYFGTLAQCVNPADSAAIRTAVERAWYQPRSAQLAEHIGNRYTWEAVAAETLTAYEQMLNRKL